MKIILKNKRILTENTYAKKCSCRSSAVDSLKGHVKGVFNLKGGVEGITGPRYLVGIDIESLPKKVLEFIKFVDSTAESLEADPPIVVSTTRTAESQAKEMVNMFFSDVEQFKKNYLVNNGQLTTNGVGIGTSIFNFLSKNKQLNKNTLIKSLSKYLKLYPISHHQVGFAVDYRITCCINTVLDLVSKSGKFKIVINDESKSKAGPHLHVSIS